MNNSRFRKGELSNPDKGCKRFSALTSILIIGAVIATLIGIGSLIFSDSSATVAASPKAEPTPKGEKKYVATRDIVVDRDTGRARKPNDQELKELVASLRSLTKRSDENLPSATLSSGGVSIDLDGGFGGTMLARPNGDGTMETRCVFTFEEAAEFLGLMDAN